MFFKKINMDLAAFMEKDPAAPHKFWVIMLWPGFHAILFYRISHMLWQSPLSRPFSRILSAFARFLTSVDIHPAAQIEEGFMIDHAIGVVIGETAVIGKNVTLYHGVTLGGVSPSVDSASQIGVKRHPTLRDNVIVGANAAILGDIIIGENAHIGANAVIVKPVEANTTVIGNPARVISKNRCSEEKDFAAYGLDNKNIRDITMEEIKAIKDRLNLIEAICEEKFNDVNSDSTAPNLSKTGDEK